MPSTKPTPIDEYISGFPKETQKALHQVRDTIKKLTPDAEECISYAIPTYKLNGTNLVHFAGFKSHVGFYPAPVAMEAFKKDFAKYKTGKGSVQFPLDQPMPLNLITKIVKFRLKDVTEQTKAKKKK